LYTYSEDFGAIGKPTVYPCARLKEKIIVSNVQ